MPRSAGGRHKVDHKKFKTQPLKVTVQSRLPLTLSLSVPSALYGEKRPNRNFGVFPAVTYGNRELSRGRCDCAPFSWKEVSSMISKDAFTSKGICYRRNSHVESMLINNQGSVFVTLFGKSLIARDWAFVLRKDAFCELQKKNKECRELCKISSFCREGNELFHSLERCVYCVGVGYTWGKGNCCPK